MDNKRININEGVISAYSKSGNLKVLHMYSCAVYLTAERGYMPLADFLLALQSLCSISERTSTRWVQVLKEHELIKVKRNTVYVLGRKVMQRRYELTRSHVQFTAWELDSYINFQNHVIRQCALLIQRRFKHAFKEISSEHNAASLVQSGKIETLLEFVDKKDKVGCSISQLVKFLGLDKRIISMALRGQVVKQFNTSSPIPGKVFRFKYKNFLETRIQNSKEFNFKYSYQYFKDTDEYIIICSISSSIVVQSSLKRKSIAGG